MLNPICVECRQVMRVLKNGVPAVMLDENQDPYKIYNADLYMCDECSTRVISGFAQRPSYTGRSECAEKIESLKALSITYWKVRA